MLNWGGWSEIIIIAVAALILIGPKELPEVMRTCGRWLYRLQKITGQFRHHFDDLIQEGQVEEYDRAARKAFNKVADKTERAQVPAIDSPTQAANDYNYDAK